LLIQQFLSGTFILLIVHVSVGARAEINHEEVLKKRITATQATFRKIWSGAFSEPEKTEAFYKELQDILKQSNRSPKETIDALNELFDRIDPYRINKSTSLGWYKDLLVTLPWTNFNAPLSSMLQSRLSLTEDLTKDHLTTKDTSAIFSQAANQAELARRLKSKFHHSLAEANEVAHLLQLSALPDGNRGLDSTLTRSFSLEALKQLKQKVSNAYTNGEGEDKLKTVLDRDISKAIERHEKGSAEAPKKSIEPEGTLIAEPTSGHFLITQEAWKQPFLKPVIQAILEEGGKITVAGSLATSYERTLNEFPSELRKNVKLVSPAKTSTYELWSTDFHGLPIEDSSKAEKFLLDPKFYHYGASDSFPQFIEAKLTNLPVVDFGYFLEGGNLHRVPGKNGKPVVIVSDQYEKANAMRTSASPKEALEALRTQIASNATLVMVPGQNDGTGHVDMFLKPGFDGKLYVADYSRHIQTEDLEIRNEQLRAQTRLNETYRLLEPHVDLIKIPQIPTLAKSSHSKLNSLSFVGNGKKVYIIPDYPKHPLNTQINSEMTDVIGRNERDAKIRLIDGEALRTMNGVFHCVFPQVCYPF
jgi:hypothetical protein